MYNKRGNRQIKVIVAMMVCVIVFFDLSKGASAAADARPFIISVKTVADEVFEGERINLEVCLYDVFGSEFNLYTEVWYRGEMIFSDVRECITKEAKEYKTVIIEGVSEDAISGTYNVKCTSENVYGKYEKEVSFVVHSRGKIDGVVHHTEKWEEKRLIRKREKEVFWPGEKLVLEAAVEGHPDRVIAWIEGEEGNCELTESEPGVYKGFIWDSGMMQRIGFEPSWRKVVFVADYPDDSTVFSVYDIFFDGRPMYWDIHRIG